MQPSNLIWWQKGAQSPSALWTDEQHIGQKKSLLQNLLLLIYFHLNNKNSERNQHFICCLLTLYLSPLSPLSPLKRWKRILHILVRLGFTAYRGFGHFFVALVDLFLQPWGDKLLSTLHFGSTTEDTNPIEMYQVWKAPVQCIIFDRFSDFESSFHHGKIKNSDETRSRAS